MPQITVKGLTGAQMKKLSTPLMRDLAEAIGCPEDWLIFELAESRFYAGGEQVPGLVRPAGRGPGAGGRPDPGRRARRRVPAGAGHLHHADAGPVLRV